MRTRATARKPRATSQIAVRLAGAVPASLEAVATRDCRSVANLVEMWIRRELGVTWIGASRGGSMVMLRLDSLAGVLLKLRAEEKGQGVSAYVRDVISRNLELASSFRAENPPGATPPGS